MIAPCHWHPPDPPHDFPKIRAQQQCHPHPSACQLKKEEEAEKIAMNKKNNNYNALVNDCTIDHFN